MTVLESISLFGIMLVLAALPSASVALVVTRAATSGVWNGIAVAAGIVLGDLAFVLLAALGLSVVAETMGSLFMVIKYIAGAYLIWLGFTLLRTDSAIAPRKHKPQTKRGLLSSFLAGLFLTVGDIKAIFFYASVLPMFLDLSVLQPSELLTVVLITVSAVGGVKILYALLARRIAIASQNHRYNATARKAGGAALMGAGSYLIVKT